MTPRDGRISRASDSGEPETPVVLFVDGVLVDSREAIVSSVKRALQAHGTDAAPDAIARLIGTPLHAIFREVLDPQAPEAAVDACVAVYREHYRRSAVAATAVFDGIPETLAVLARRWRLAVATSKPQTFAAPLLEGAGLRGLFDSITGPDLSAWAERKDETVRRAIRTASPHPVKALVGDRHFDISAAKANGLLAIGVLWGYGTESELREAGADTILSEPADLPTVLPTGGAVSGL